MPPRTSAWTPLRHPAFRVAWLTFFGAQLATWSETVGAVEVIAAQSASVALLALVQAASTAPMFLLALPAGVATDLVDRRRLLLAVIGAMALAMGALSATTASDHATPAVVLALTLVMGAGIAVSLPAFSAVIPELLPREQLASGVTLVSISINLARALGPALAGVTLALINPATLFGLLAAVLVVTGAMLAFGPQAGGAPPARGVRPVAAMREGLAFARRSDRLRPVLVRGGAFTLPASALWAVLPAVAVQRLDLDAAAFGGILAAVGVGAVAGAQVLGWLRARLTLDQLLRLGTAYGAVNLALLALVHVTWVLVGSLVLAGAAWVAVLSSVNTAAQLASPAWVRGRALSINQLVFSGGMAAGSALWGVVCELTSLGAGLLAAAAVQAATLGLTRWWPLAEDDEQRPRDEQGEAGEPLEGELGGLEAEDAPLVQER